MTSLIALFGLDPEHILESGGYILLFAIIFAESGLLIGFFLPGDSLLFIAGAFCSGALGENFHPNIFVVAIGCGIAAIAGDQVGYLIGAKAGRKILQRPGGFILKQETLDNAVARTEVFFEHYGAKAVIAARFVPVVRTFVPTIAGISHMNYSRFLRFNVIGGVIWGVGIPILGYFVGQIDVVKNNIEIALPLIVGISFIPVIVEVVRHRSKAKKAAAVTAADEPAAQ